MLMMIIGMSLLYSYVMSYLHISQSAAESIVAMHLPRWELLAAILVMVVVLGFFLPPVSIILMTAPIILPPLRAANFDIIWFGIIMTIVMEMGLIHPPVGLNIFVIRNVAPDIPLSEVIWGTLPFVLLMMLAVLDALLRAGDFDLAAGPHHGTGWQPIALTSFAGVPIDKIVSCSVIDEKVRNRFVASLQTDAPRQGVFVDLTVRKSVGTDPMPALIALCDETTISVEAQIHEPGMIGVAKHDHRRTIVGSDRQFEKRFQVKAI